MRREYWLLIALFALVLALRLYVSFQVAEPGYRSYFTLIQADAIQETGTPRYHDAYSYGGRDYQFSAIFYYIIGGLLAVLPDVMALKVLPNIFMASMVPLTFLICYNITRNRKVALAGAFFSGFSPVLFSSFLNEASIESLSIPFVLLALYATLLLDEKPVLGLSLLAFVTLVTPYVWIAVAVYFAHILILAAEKMKLSGRILEAGLLLSLLSLWYSIIIYRDAFQLYGLGIFRAGYPVVVQQEAFTQLTLLGMIYAVGVVPLALGSLGIYFNTFEMRTRKTFLFIAFSLVTLCAAFLRVLPLQSILLLLSGGFAVLAAIGLHNVSTYLRKTWVSGMYPYILSGFLILFVLTSLLPSLAGGIYPQSSPTPKELAALSWLKNHSSNSTMIAAVPSMGFLINHVVQRPYVADEKYLLAPNVEQRLQAIDRLYTSPSQVLAVRQAQQYGVTHIFLGPQEHATYRQLGTFVDNPCFPLLYDDFVRIYGVNCTVRST